MSGDRSSASVERVIHAPASAIFELLADPAGHERIDGSGSVQGARGGSKRLSLGDTFSVRMKSGVPDVSSNKVIEFEQDRRIAWQQTLGRQIWRYELTPVEGGTLVRETFDGTKYLGRPLLGVLGVIPKHRVNMARTLDRIEELLT
jgi:uncharacterized protein YndB with AHSA1/START domain